MTNPVFEALKKLDPANDEQWTSDGMPRIEAVEKIYGEPVSRKQINDAAPDFNRELAVAAPPPEQPDKEGPVDEDDFDKEYLQLVGEIEEVDRQVDKLEKQRLNLRRRLAKSEARRAELFPPATQANMVQAFQASQQKQRQESFDEAARVRQLVGNKAKVVGGNPADEGT